MTRGILLCPCDNILKARVFEESQVQLRSMCQDVQCNLEVELVTETLVKESVYQTAHFSYELEPQSERKPRQYGADVLRLAVQGCDYGINQPTGDQCNCGRHNAEHECESNHTYRQRRMR